MFVKELTYFKVNRRAASIHDTLLQSKDVVMIFGMVRRCTHNDSENEKGKCCLSMRQEGYVI